MKKTASILVVEDEEKMRELLQKILSTEGYVVQTTSNGSAALSMIEENPFDIVLTDVKMPGLGGIELLKAIKGISPETYVIIMTAFGTIDSAVEAMKQGAYDYISKPFKMDEIRILLKKILDEKALRHEVDTLRREVKRRYQYSNIIGKSKSMQEVFELIERVSDGKSTVLIQGRSGTGKELVAKAIHYNGPRKNNPFMAVNCSAIPETLLESELFGHVKGAFTGAVTTKTGLFEEADGGTLFLDEIGDLSLAMQVKLLRVLQDFEVRPVGSTKVWPVDVRIISATHKDIDEAVEQGEFREDLLYRLKVVPLHMPELAERRDDIPLLAEHFLGEYAKKNHKQKKRFAPDAMDYLVSMSWPGNIRQLNNVVELCAVLCTSEIIPMSLTRQSLQEKPVQIQTLREAKQAFERSYLTGVLRITNGHVANAARIAGRNRTEFYKLLNQYNIDPVQFRVKKTDGKQEE